MAVVAGRLYPAKGRVRYIEMMLGTNWKWYAAIGAMFFLQGGCQRLDPDSKPSQILRSPLAESIATMKVSSTAFDDGSRIGQEHTADGNDVSPSIAWEGVPNGVQSFALICDDPDAPSPQNPADEPWVHWVLFNIPAEMRELSEGVDRDPEPQGIPGARQGQNSWPNNNIGYRGPAPPPGSGTHRYIFKVYALDAILDLNAGATKKELLQAISGHVLAEGHLTGTYER